MSDSNDFEEARRFMQKTNLLALANSKDIQFTDTWFPYTSGEVGPYYIQSLGVTANGEDYDFAIKSMKALFEHQVREFGYKIDGISGGETRDWDFSNPLAYALKLPHAKLFESRPPLGAPITGKKFMHVADLNNEGSSMRDKWAPTIRNNGGDIVAALFFVDRLEKGVGVMKELGIPNTAVVPMDGYAWQVLLDANHVSPNLYKSLMERNEDTGAWARRMLRAYPEPLISLLQGNPKDVSKGENILTKGYPDMRAELVDLMREKGFEYTGGTK